MAAILPFLSRDRKFNPEMIEAMGLAYELARAELAQRCSSPPSDESIAQVIIDLASTGEYEPTYMYACVIEHFGLDQKQA